MTWLRWYRDRARRVAALSWRFLSGQIDEWSYTVAMCDHDAWDETARRCDDCGFSLTAVIERRTTAMRAVNAAMQRMGVSMAEAAAGLSAAFQTWAKQFGVSMGNGKGGRSGL